MAPRREFLCANYVAYIQCIMQLCRLATLKKHSTGSQDRITPFLSAVWSPCWALSLPGKLFLGPIADKITQIKPHWRSSATQVSSGFGAFAVCQAIASTRAFPRCHSVYCRLFPRTLHLPSYCRSILQPPRLCRGA